MTTTDRRDATDAQFADELARLNRLDVADEGAVERVVAAERGADQLDIYGDLLCGHGAASSESHRRCRARAAIDALKPAPGTDTSTEDALHRVLDLADEYEAAGHLPNLSEFDRGVGAHQRDAAARIRAAVAGPQRDHDEEGGQ